MPPKGKAKANSGNKAASKAKATVKAAAPKVKATPAKAKAEPFVSSRAAAAKAKADTKDVVATAPASKAKAEAKHGVATASASKAKAEAKDKVAAAPLASKHEAEAKDEVAVTMASKAEAEAKDEVAATSASKADAEDNDEVAAAAALAKALAAILEASEEPEEDNATTADAAPIATYADADVATEEAAQKARENDEAAPRIKEEAEQKEAELEKQEAERKAKAEEAASRAREVEAALKAKEEVRRKEAEQQQQEAERKASEDEVARNAREADAARKAKEEAERKEGERKRQEAERKANEEEAARKAREVEAALKAKEEEERKEAERQKQEAERKASEQETAREAARKAKEEAERKEVDRKKQEAEGKAKEEEEARGGSDKGCKTNAESSVQAPASVPSNATTVEAALAKEETSKVDSATMPKTEAPTPIVAGHSRSDAATDGRDVTTQEASTPDKERKRSRSRDANNSSACLETEVNKHKSRSRSPRRDLRVTTPSKTDAPDIYGTLVSETKPDEPFAYDPSRVWNAGDMIVVEGLLMKVELNGRFAKIAQKSEASPTASNVTRYIVLLDEPLKDGTMQFSVKHEHLRPRPSQPAPSDAPSTNLDAGTDTGKRNTSSPSSKKPSGFRNDDYEATEDRKPFEGPVGGLFDSNLEKLRKKAEAEARGELPRRAEKREKAPESNEEANAKAPKVDKPAGVDSKTKERLARHGEYDSETLAQGVNFLPAAEVAVPIRKVVVVDPRRAGERKKNNNDDDSSDVDVEPGVIKPPVRPAWAVAEPKETWWPENEWVPVSMPNDAQKASSGTENASESTKASEDGAATVVTTPAPAPAVSSVPAPLAAFQPTPGGHLKLSVSETARAEDKTARENSIKKNAIEEGKKKMLEKLTTQLKTCLARIQSGDLDDTAKEKYQDMIALLKMQMTKVSGAT